MKMFNAIEQFTEALKSHSLYPSEPIHTDGKIHRFSTNENKSDNAGWYIYHDLEIPWGSFGCHRRQIHESWVANIGREMLQRKKMTFHQNKEMLLTKEKGISLIHKAQAKSVIKKFLESLEMACNHDYLATKAVKPYSIRIHEDQLIIPMYFDEELVSYQRIFPDGQKRFATEGQTKGCYFIIGDITNSYPLCICEGYATGASIYEATNYPTVIAFSAENLKQVAQLFRDRYNTRKIIICSDDDWKKEPNVGLTRAKEAASKIKAFVVTPKFETNREDKMTDFNDMHVATGLSSVKNAIDEANVSDIGQAIGHWTNPLPLPSMPNVAPFKLELLPEALREWVQDIADNMQCPPDFPAVGAIVTLSSLIGARAHISVKVNAEWIAYPNLWGMLIGRPSTKKTPSLESILKPIYQMQLDESERMKIETKKWDIEKSFNIITKKVNENLAKKEIEIGQIEKAKTLLMEPPLAEMPQERRFIINDATVEKMGEILKYNPYGVLCYRDELHGFFQSMEKSGQEASRSFYLTGYNGNAPYTYDRIGRGTITIPRVCLSLLGGIQPGRLQEYINCTLNGGSGDDGFIQRFSLAVYPDTNKNFKYVDREPNLEARNRAMEVFERLSKLIPNDINPWRFTQQAQKLFVEWYTSLELRVIENAMHPAMDSHLLKYSKLIPSLALIFTLIDNPNDKQEVAEPELSRAIAWGTYLSTHAERMYHSANKPRVIAASRLISEITKGNIKDLFTAREIAQKNWSGLDAVEFVNPALELLLELGYLQSTTSNSIGGGRSSTKYIINPLLQIKT